MNVTDPIADLLTRIRNGIHANKDSVDVPTSKLKNEILRILVEEGFISRFEPVVVDGHDRIRISLKYGPRRSKVIREIKRISKPGLRVYRPAKEVPRVHGGLGIAILTTSQGVMTDRRARQLGVGGEVLCIVS
ncbi:MAG TPA: 30S ribosomal protein S8 [Armatimonadota bacterium]|jgi:small subunit ribosomal protein S8